MGALFSRRRAQFAPAHMLESIEKRIDALDAKRRQIAAADQSTSNNIIAVFGVALAVLAIYMLVIFRPLDALRIVQLIIILLVACIPLFLVQHLVHYFYQRKLAWNECALEQARKERTDVLDRIKETETYKVANDLLEKFDPAIKSAKAAAIARETEERERETSRQAAIVQQQLIRQQQQQLRPAASPTVPVVEQQQQQVQLESTMAAARLRIPRPVLQQVRTPVDKMVDFILGDGPNYRYALICVHCHCHNGLALAEQFEYLSFRCGYCFTFNHAPKQQQQSQNRSSNNDHRAILPSTDDNNIETSSLSHHNSIHSEHNESGSDIIVAPQSAAEMVTTSLNDGMSTNDDCDESVQDPVPSIPQS